MTTPVYVLVGAGGTGSILYQPLMRFLKTHHGATNYIVAVIDGDHVETKNLERQLFTESDNQNAKAGALVQAAGHSEGRAINEFLDDDNVEHRIREGDTVLICADNFDVRQRIERRALQLQDVTVINGGNEALDGSVQIFVRRSGENLTPPLSFQHPEILRSSAHDPTKLSCQQRAEVPGGEQTIIANMMSATMVLNALRRVLAVQDMAEKTTDADPAELPGFLAQTWTLVPHEAYFDLATWAMRGNDLRSPDNNWAEHDPYREAVPA